MDDLLDTNSLRKFIQSLVPDTEAAFQAPDHVLSRFIAAHVPETLFIAGYTDDEATNTDGNQIEKSKENQENQEDNQKSNENDQSQQIQESNNENQESHHEQNQHNDIQSHTYQTIPLFGYHVVDDVSQLPPPTFLTMIIKQKNPLTKTTDLHHAVNVVNMAGVSSTNGSYEVLRSVISHGLVPYFDMMAPAQAEDAIQITRKKFGELALSLQHLQQRIQVPDLLASTHPAIKRTLANLTKDLGESELDTIMEESQLAQLSTNAVFLNELTHIVNGWIGEVQAVTRLTHSPHDGESIHDEVQFWRSMEQALLSIVVQLGSAEVRLSIKVLNKAKRFHITLSFQNDLGVADKMASARMNNALLRELPLDELAAASTDLAAVERAVVGLFGHLKSRLKNLSSYPLTRAVELVEVMVGDIEVRVRGVLAQSNIMALAYREFLELCDTALAHVFQVVDQNIKFMVNLVRELLRKRQEKFVVIKIEHDGYTALKARVAHLRALRAKHADLVEVLELFLGDGSRLTEAYSRLLMPLNAVDVSPQGRAVLRAREEAYLAVHLQWTGRVVSRLNERLDACATLAEYLAVVRRFDGAARSTLLLLVNDEHKLRILTAASQEVDHLVEMNTNTTVAAMAMVQGNKGRGGQYLAKIMWQLGLRSKLEFYEASLEELLGSEWSAYATGTKIAGVVKSALSALCPETDFEEWLGEVDKEVEGFGGRVFEKTKGREDENDNEKNNHEDDHEDHENNFVLSIPTLEVPPTSSITQLFTLSPHFKIPVSLHLRMRRVQQLHPFVAELEESIQLLDAVHHDLRETPHGQRLGFLARRHGHDVTEAFARACDVEWWQLARAVELQAADPDAAKEHLVEIQALRSVNEFQLAVYLFYEATSQLAVVDAVLRAHYEGLHECEYTVEALGEHIIAIHAEYKRLVDMDGMDRFARMIDSEVREILLKRCADELSSVRLEMDKVSAHHFLIFEDQAFVVLPEFETVKQHAFERVNDVIAVVEGQPMVTPGVKVVQGGNFDSPLSQLTSSIFCHVDSCIDMAGEFVQKWRMLQNLWELNVDTEEDIKKLGGLVGTKSMDLQASLASDESLLSGSLSPWTATMDNVLALRAVFDRAEPFRDFSMIRVDFSKVQSRVTLRYDSFQASFFRAFSVHFGTSLSELVRELDVSRASLERRLDFQADLATIVRGIADHHRFSDLIPAWKSQIEHYSQIQLTMVRHRHKFALQWVYVEQLDTMLQTIEALAQRKQELLAANAELAESKIKAEALRVDDSVRALEREWPDKKPVLGLEPAAAIAQLDAIGARCASVSSARAAVVAVATRLNVAIARPGTVGIIEDEIADFKTVWASINTLWEGLERVKLQKWVEVPARVLRRQLDELLTTSRSLPAKVRQYAAFVEIQTEIKGYLKEFGVIADLKDDAMKERHWKRLFGDDSFGDFDVRKVLSINFTLQSALIREVLAQAASEKTIEDNLGEIQATWATLTFETFSYHNRCRLVRNWDVLFDQCNGDISTLASMRNLVHYGAFEADVTAMADRLSRLYVVLDTWIDVQRQWVYLDGVFGSATSDIRALLPLELTRFTNITYEFMSTLKRVYAHKAAIDVGSADFHFGKLLASLVKVRRSLTDYLERQRELFPRFYFVGNEDLLELIGCGTDMARVNRHLKKMFAGIALVEATDTMITAVVSDGGERVVLSKPVDTNTRLNEWLNALDLEVRMTLAQLVAKCLQPIHDLIETPENLSVFDDIPAQISTVALQVGFTRVVEQIFDSYRDDLATHLAPLLEKYTALLAKFSSAISHSSPSASRKLQYLVIEVLHQRDILERLATAEVPVFEWSIQQRFYYDSTADALESVTIKQSNSTFVYGFEYLGLPEKLAYTPLIDKCFLAMTQALDQRMGGAPFGPAGTGKTESIKALGHNLGKMVLVFCCDDTFDFQSMSRIFLGLCKVGSWGCFDEFNRLDERILSAVSSQIERIEIGLRTGDAVEMSGREFSVHPETGLFVTMNPGYAGRFELPENLKKLFRGFSMEEPDREIIAEVLLTSQTFVNAKALAKMLVPLMAEIEHTCSQQSHYDFGLRALKGVLGGCGRKKKVSKENRDEKMENGEDVTSSLQEESATLLSALTETILPRLTHPDAAVFTDVVAKYFVGIPHSMNEHVEFIRNLKEYASQHALEALDQWVSKCVQLYQVQATHHGVMLVGDAGTGKSRVWELVLYALGRTERMDVVSHVLDCKVLSKEQIYGSLDMVTREWTDGLLTLLLRRIRANLRGELSKTTWIVFDGDVDPEWAENLNSVLDDNRLLTLPNGERIALPDCVRLIFEVDSLRYTTPATVSRVGMVWFGEMVGINGLVGRMIADLAEDLGIEGDREYQDQFVRAVKDNVTALRVGKLALAAQTLLHIMEFSAQRVIGTLGVMLRTEARRYVKYCVEQPHVPVELDKFVWRAAQIALAWAFGGGVPIAQRDGWEQAVKEVYESDNSSKDSLFSSFVTLPYGTFEHWNTQLDTIDLEPHDVISPTTVVPTLDTLRHEHLIHSILEEHHTLLLCGPPGSGKTMTLLGALRRSPRLDVLPLNFSKETSPESLMRSLEQHCQYTQTPGGLTLGPRVAGKWVVVFCDEVNLPGVDRYGTQKVISLLRQMVEQNGFWRVRDQQWVTLHNVQFVGACNSPKDPGRHPLSPRFLRHVSIVMVDYPGPESLKQIYDTFGEATMKCAPDLRGFTLSITALMIEVYTTTCGVLAGKQPHYVYSPRELTRWIRGLLQGLRARDYTRLNELVRLWYHEGLRLFYDRLVNEADRKFTMDLFDEVISKHFPNVSATQKPVFFSSWLTLAYELVDAPELRSFVAERLRVFSEEETETELILHEDVLEHALRIDRVLRQPQGHMILAGPPTRGKTTLVRFVAWINGLKVERLAVRTGYTLADFDESLRGVLLRCARGERVCFVVDESCIVDASFVERMNTLLANAEIPGLFEGQENVLLSVCRDQLSAQGLLLEEPELYSWFMDRVVDNLHVVFTVGSPENEQKDRDSYDNSSAASLLSSPALFNRCVLSWMGDYSEDALFSIGRKMVNVPAGSKYEGVSLRGIERATLGDAMVDLMVKMHTQLTGGVHYPSSFFLLISHFSKILSTKQDDLEEMQRHVTAGLDRLRETVAQVKLLKLELQQKQTFLEQKDREAKAMLSRMLTEQNEAERKEEFSLASQEELEKQEVIVTARRSAVMEDLAKAEPAVIAAREGVQNIKKQHLTEIRSMANPPAAVKLTMESVCVLLGHTVSTWREVQQVVRRDDFISSIVDFDNEGLIDEERRREMETKYLLRDDYNYATVHRASKACGPLLQWVLAQVSYSKVLQSIGPMRAEVAELEQRTKKTRAQLIALDQMIAELRQSIEQYKEDYSTLIREAENTKTAMRLTEERVSRAMQLVDSLTSERNRWKTSVDRFEAQRERLPGNALMASAFLVYAGGLDQQQREDMMAGVRAMLAEHKIEYDELEGAEYISMEEIKDVKDEGAFKEDEETLQVPHSGLSLQNICIIQHSTIPLIVDPSNEILPLLKATATITSFLNELFVRQLENALRFGGILVVQDAEHYDPIVDPVLRRELRRNGGRTTITIRGNEIDYLPQFRMYLYTRDPAVSLLPFVRSRTTLVSFTVTSGSLASTVLERTLEELHPDVAKKRADLMALQGVYQARLRGLERDLLALLSASTSSILENDLVVKTLETIKTEAVDIDSKIALSSAVMAEVDRVRTESESFARHCTRIFGLLSNFARLGHFYHFSLDTFLGIFGEVLKNRGDLDALYRETFAVIAPSLNHKDRVVLAMGLARERRLDDEDAQEGDTTDLSFLFSGIGPYSSKYDLAHWAKTTLPIMLVSPDGYDAASTVERCAQSSHSKLAVVSMGSKEGIEIAERELANAAAQATWVLIQNIQMSPSWLKYLERCLDGYDNAHVFLTCTTGSRVPTSLVSRLKVLLYDVQPGLRNVAHETLGLVSSSIVKGPREIIHVVILLVWYHTLVVERLRYAPISFAKKYDINDADFTSALQVIMSLFLRFGSRTHVAPDAIPWLELRYLIGTITYGGKVDNKQDLVYFEKIAERLFTVDSFEESFNAVENELTMKLEESLSLPEGASSLYDIREWVSTLPETTPLTWIGLEEDVDVKMRVREDEEVHNLLAMV